MDRKLATIFASDVVVFSKYSGTEVKVGDKIYLIVNESDILAKKS